MSPNTKVGSSKKHDDPERSLRRAAVLSGVLLSLQAAVPWVYRRDLHWMWELTDEVDAPLFLFPLAGVLLLASRYTPRLPPAARALGVLTGGALAYYGLLSLFETRWILSEVSYEFRRADALRVQLLVLSPCVAAAGEIAYQRSERMRLGAWLSALGYTFFIAVFFLPLQPGDLDTSPAAFLGELVDELDRDASALIAIIPALMLLLVFIAGAILSVRRAIAPDDVRANLRFRTARLPVALVMLPGILTAIVTFFVVLNEGDAEVAFTSYHLVALTLAPAVALTFGSGHTAGLMLKHGAGLSRQARHNEMVRHRVLAVAAALGVMAVLFVGYKLYRALGPDPRQAEAAQWSFEVGEAVLAASWGDDYDHSLWGGYPELDLRASEGALAEVVSANERPEIVAVVFALTATVDRQSFSVTGIATDRTTLRYLRADANAHPTHAQPLEFAADPVEAFAVSLHDHLTGIECLPPLEIDDVPEPLARVYAADHDALDQACQSVESAEYRRLGMTERAPRGQLGRFDVVVRSGERYLALRGALHNEYGRLWIGAVEISELQ